jgi:hypothetical protein
MDLSTLDRVANQAIEISERAHALRELLTPADVKEATECLLVVRQMQGTVEEEIGPLVKAAHTTHKRAVEFRKSADEPLREAEGILKMALADYSDLEHHRLLKAEAAREAEVAKLAAARADAGDPIDTMPVVYAKPTSVVQGISTKQSFKPSVTDIKAFLRAIVDTLEDDDLRRLITFKQSILQVIADDLGAGVDFPGLTVTAHRIVRFKPADVKQEEPSQWEV